MFQALLAPLASIGGSIASGLGAAGSAAASGASTAMSGLGSVGSGFLHVLGSVGSKAASLAGDGLSSLGKNSGVLNSSGAFDWNGLANAALRTANGAGQGFVQGYTGQSPQYTSGAPQIPMNFNFNLKNPFAD